jgi:2-polyprenyl-6-hydroxyphenyl methylase/3-demethylubiquinone-9 3-methyltransferase
MHAPDEDRFAVEVKAGARFGFGKNWQQFLPLVDEQRVATAQSSLSTMLGDLSGRTFLDVGSGTGLFSLAARRLGARVRSFDYDPQSVACTLELRQRFFPGDDGWTVERGSILDAKFVAGLGRHDVVYAWGVLHHTGAMMAAVENASSLVAPRGKLYLGIYNHQGAITRYWTAVKRLYNRNAWTRYAMIATHAPYLFGARFAARAVTGRLGVRRGMSMWRDMVDWLGGYPFEAAKPEQIVEFCVERGFELTKLKTCGGRMGCNDFVFTACK